MKRQLPKPPRLRTRKVLNPGSVRQRVERLARLGKPPRPKPTPSGEV